VTHTHLYLIRHGEAYCNVPPFTTVAGMKGDEGLTPRGRLQAERLRDRLAATREIPADVLIASSLPRARQTAEIVQPAFGLPIRFDDEVQEQRPGALDGLPWAEVKDQFPDFRKDPFAAPPPGGETWAQFVLRAGAALDRIAKEHAGKTLAVVCHGGVIDASLVLFFGLPTLTPPWARVHTRNTSITHWRREQSDESWGVVTKTRDAFWRLMCYNDDLHTRDLDRPERIGWAPLVPEGRDEEQRGDEPAVPLPTEEPLPDES
jgi:probable phosphoglycerate mutase